MMLFAALFLAAIASAELPAELMTLEIATVKAIKVRELVCPAATCGPTRTKR